jgi:hypothetical protein
MNQWLLLRLAVWQTLWWTLLAQPTKKFQNMPSTPEMLLPQLNGQHFRITAIEQGGYIKMDQDEKTGEISYSGYLIDILRAISREDRGNFTYDLFPPSGFGSACIGRLDFNDNITLQSPEAYSKPFRTQFKCGESDVNDRPLSEYSTDMYWGMYYITPQRLSVSKFTIPFSPPQVGSLGMIGTATRILSIPDLAQNHTNIPVCAFEGTAYMDIVAISFPSLDIHPLTPSEGAIEQALRDGTCEVIIAPMADMPNTVKFFSEKGMCLFNDSVSWAWMVSCVCAIHCSFFSNLSLSFLFTSNNSLLELLASRWILD